MAALILIIVFLAFCAEIKSLRRSVEDVCYDRKPSVRSVEQGQEFLIKTTIENRSGKDIPYLFLEEIFPDELELLDKDRMELAREKGYYLFKSVLFLKKRQRIKRTIRVTAQRRGIIRIAGARLKIGDFLGLKELEKRESLEQSVVVYPVRLEDMRLEQVVSDILGEISVNSFLYEDPILVKGYRDYTGQEPMRAISFLMSAKRNQLTVREFDHTREAMVDLIFDVSYKGDFEHYFTRQEALFSIVRTICETLEQKGISYRLITNAYYAAMEVHGVNVIRSGGSGGSSMTKILEVLGMASNAAMCDTAEVLSYVFRNFSREKSFLYICHRKEETNEELLDRLTAQYRVKIHRMYGTDFEESYLRTQNREEKKAK